MMYFDYLQVNDRNDRVYYYLYDVWGTVSYVGKESFTVTLDREIITKNNTHIKKVVFDFDGRDYYNGGARVLFEYEPQIKDKPFDVKSDIRRLTTLHLTADTYATITFNSHTNTYDYSLMNVNADCFQGNCFPVAEIPFQFDGMFVDFVNDLNKKKVSYNDFLDAYISYHKDLMNNSTLKI